MNILARLAPTDTWARLILTDALMILGLIGGAAVLGRIACHRRAAARHGLWLATLALVVLSPAVVLVRERAGLGRWTVPISLARAEVRPEVVAAVTEAPREVGLWLSADRLPGAGPPPPTGPEVPRRDRPEVPAAARVPPIRPGWTRDEWAGLAVVAWLVGLVVGLLRLGSGWRALARLRGRLRPLDLTAQPAILSAVRAALGVADLPPIFTAPAVREPFAAGVTRPMVVLPVDLDERDLRDVLIHECAHLIRRDLAVGLLQRVATVALWPHPAIHFLNRHLNQAREEVCDNFVLRVSDARGYARTLLTLTERRQSPGLASPALGIVGAGWTLADRVAGLLDPQRNRMTHSSRRARVTTVAALIGVCLGLATVQIARPPARAADPVTGRLLVPPPPEAPMDAGRRVVGVVVDEAGRPVRGAVVRPVRLAKAPEGVTSADDGTFTLGLRGPMLLQEALIAEADGGARLGLGEFRERSADGPAAPVRIVLKASRSVAVRVRDASGVPVPGATVEVGDYTLNRPGRTGPDGVANVRIPADGPVRWVLAHKAEVGFDYFENYPTKHARDLPPLPAEVALTLDGASPVRIRAVDAAGQPVAGVQFSPWYIGKPGKLEHANVGGWQTVGATTDAGGVATFGWLPTRVDPGVPFLIHPGPYSCPQSPVYTSQGAVTLTARLLRNTPIAGIVRGTDGQPAAGILIQAEGRGATNHYCRMFARTGADGRYRIDVYADQVYLIAVADPAWAARSLTSITVLEGRPEEGLDLNLIAGTLLQGQVTRDADRSPARGVPLSLVQGGAARLEGADTPKGGRDEDQTLVRFGTTDDQGHYQFRVGPGRFQLLAPGTSTPPQELTVGGTAAATITLDIHLTKPEEPS